MIISTTCPLVQICISQASVKWSCNTTSVYAELNQLVTIQPTAFQHWLSHALWGKCCCDGAPIHNAQHSTVACCSPCQVPTLTVTFWRCRVGLALLKVSEEQLILLPFEQLLAALNSKQLPAFGRSPNSLLKLALSFRVSKRLNQFRLEHAKSLASPDAPDSSAANS